MKDEIRSKINELTEQKNEVIQNIEAALNLKHDPKTAYEPPDKVRIQWDADDFDNHSSVKYYVKITGILLSTECGQCTETMSIYNEEIAATEFTRQNGKLYRDVQDEKLYRAVGLKVTLSREITAVFEDEEISLPGREYSLKVPNVHPTLKQPASVSALYDASSWTLKATSATVEFADTYLFHIGEDSSVPFHVLAQCTSVKSNAEEGIICSFSHQDIPSGSQGPLKVRCQAIAGQDSGIRKCLRIF